VKPKIECVAVTDRVAIRMDLSKVSRQGVLLLTHAEAYRLMLSLMQEQDAAQAYGERHERMDRGSA
jgi:hypothetical protein